MRKLALILVAFVGLFFVAAAPASAGSCPRNTSCASEDRSVTRIASAAKVTITACISQANWNALNAYWKAKGYSGNCFWWASSRQGDKTKKVYARCGSITVYAGRAYAYNGRANWDYFNR